MKIVNVSEVLKTFPNISLEGKIRLIPTFFKYSVVYFVDC